MFLRLLIIVVLMLVGAAVLSYLNPAADKSENFLLNGLSVVRSWFTNERNMTPDSKLHTTTVYKWRDADGNWQFSNEPPPPGIYSDITIYRSDTNVTPALKTPAPTPDNSDAAGTQGPEPGAGFIPINDPDKIKQILEDARKVQQQAEQHQPSQQQ